MTTKVLLKGVKGIVNLIHFHIVTNTVWDELPFLYLQRDRISIIMTLIASFCLSNQLLHVINCL